jgi:AcrR family transcriptional regulator
MPKTADPGRKNQRRRTRKDLLSAASRLLKRGGGSAPSMDDIADEAMVSRATAYRYFPTVDAILVEAPLDGAVPNPDEIFARDRSSDAALRVDKAESAMHEMTYRNQAQLKRLLIASLERTANGAHASIAVPVRQNRRSELIEAALAPARRQFTDAAYKKLCAALALIFGLESMIVFNDVLGMDQKAARKVKSWAIQSLVQAALRESRGRV